MKEALTEALYSEMYIAHTDNGKIAHDTCPDCGKETYVYEEGFCLSCEYTIQESENCSFEIDADQ